jgi:hypothetical protein
MPRSLLTAYQKERIIASYELGWGPSDIAQILGLSAGAVKMHRSRHEKIKDLPPREKSNKRMIKGITARKILQIVEERPTIGYRSIPGLLEDDLPAGTWIPKPTTVREFLHRSGLEKRKLPQKPPLSAANVAKRLDFGNRWLVDGRDTLGNVIWTDETSIRSKSSGTSSFLS